MVGDAVDERTHGTLSEMKLCAVCLFMSVCFLLPIHFKRCAALERVRGFGRKATGERLRHVNRVSRPFCFVLSREQSLLSLFESLISHVVEFVDIGKLEERLL